LASADSAEHRRGSCRIRCRPCDPAVTATETKRAQANWRSFAKSLTRR
jgi:hypothetical protein